MRPHAGSASTLRRKRRISAQVNTHRAAGSPRGRLCQHRRPRPAPPPTMKDRHAEASWECRDGGSKALAGAASETRAGGAIDASAPWLDAARSGRPSGYRPNDGRSDRGRDAQPSTRRFWSGSARRIGRSGPPGIWPGHARRCRRRRSSRDAGARASSRQAGRIRGAIRARNYARRTPAIRSTLPTPTTAERSRSSSNAGTTFGDVGAAARSTAAQGCRARRAHGASRGRAMGAPRASGSCATPPATGDLVAAYPEVFRSRFPGSSSAWVRALTSRRTTVARPSPVWSGATSTRREHSCPADHCSHDQTSGAAASATAAAPPNHGSGSGCGRPGCRPGRPGGRAGRAGSAARSTRCPGRRRGSPRARCRRCRRRRRGGARAGRTRRPGRGRSRATRSAGRASWWRVASASQIGKSVMTGPGSSDRTMPALPSSSARASASYRARGRRARPAPSAGEQHDAEQQAAGDRERRPEPRDRVGPAAALADPADERIEDEQRRDDQQHVDRAGGVQERAPGGRHGEDQRRDERTSRPRRRSAAEAG